MDMVYLEAYKMSEGKVLFDGVGPKTQSVESVKVMLEYLKGEQLRELPAVVRLANGWQLTRSSKGDAYYMTSPRECSCPGFCYRRTCQHVKSLRGAGEQQPQKKDEQLSESQIFARNIVAAMES